MNKVTLIAFAPLVARALLQTIAGSQVVDEDLVQKAAGVVIFIVSVLWSHYEKKKITSGA